MGDFDVVRGPGDRNAARPVIRGQRGVVSAGHPFAAAAGNAMLRDGGNAIDAGVAAGLVTNVVHHDLTSFGGVAPIILYSAATREVTSISGLGRWPKAASLSYFQEEHDGAYPTGVLRSVIPAAPDAWLTALKDHGSMTFTEVAQPAIRYAKHGYPVYEFQRNNISADIDGYTAFPSTASVFLRDGNPPDVGEVIVQEDLARTFERLAAAEQQHGDREMGLQAAREYFYTGPIGQEIAAFSQEHGGFLDASDLAEFSVQTEPPVHIEFNGYDVYTCGPWCQGPVFAQALQLVDMFDLVELGHNSPAYLHVILEALKLAFADREWYYGDPEFVDVPIDELTTASYAANRAELIDMDSAFSSLPPPGDTDAVAPDVFALDDLVTDPAAPESPFASGVLRDTSYIAVLDADGNVFSATPSDSVRTTPIIPGIGTIISKRGLQSRLDPRHPASLEPWKRPRLTPNPALVLKDDEPFMAIGTPGGDVQPQAMLQVFLNQVVFGMNPQEAIEAPRVSTYSFPGSFFPHRYYPGVSAGEARIDDAVFAALRERGHQMERWGRVSKAGGVNVVMRDPVTGVLHGGADSRRENYAIGD